MCLAVPARILTLEADQQAEVDLHGNRLHISTMLVPEVVVGDWVLVHAGFAIQRLDEKEAHQTFAVLNDLAAAGEQERSP